MYSFGTIKKAIFAAQLFSIHNSIDMNLETRISAFCKLHDCLAGWQSNPDLSAAAHQARNQNSWFAEPLVRQAFEGVALLTRPDLLRTWLLPYHDALSNTASQTIGLVAAGNIPMVCFHDLMCILLSGHKLLFKPSSIDTVLPLAVLKILVQIEPLFADYIQTAERLNPADAYIATGSDNSARYFQYYLGRKPALIRKNRHSIAVLNGQETQEQLLALGHDVLDYYGLGCRNVSKIYVPSGYDFMPLFHTWQSLDGVGMHHKYANNYDYNKAIYLINQVVHYDIGFMLISQNDALASPLAVLHYQYYDDMAQLESQISPFYEKIQCVVASDSLPFYSQSVGFGQSQTPLPQDYADNTDTMLFLTGLGGNVV